MRTTGDDAVCTTVHEFLLIRTVLQLFILENTMGEPDLTLNINMTVTIGFNFFRIYTFGLNYKVMVNFNIYPGMHV